MGLSFPPRAMKEVGQLLPTHLTVYSEWLYPCLLPAFLGPHHGLQGFPEGQGFSLPELAWFCGGGSGGSDANGQLVFLSE